MRAATPRYRRRVWSRGILLAALVGLFSSVAPMVAAAADPVVLRIGQASEDASTSPLNFSGWVSTGLTYDMLVGADPAGQPVPAFAESWSVADDGVTWTIKIRPGMTWSDGEPADANDVAFTINAVTPGTDPTWGGPYFSYWGLHGIESTTVVDDLTLQVVTKPPKRDWLPTSRIFVLPEHIWKDVNLKDDQYTFNPALPSVGTGPYVLSEVQAGQFRRFVRNEGYWGPRPAVDEILLIPFKSQDAMAAALRNGEIDIASGIGVGQVEQLTAATSISLLEVPQNGWSVLAFNNSGNGASTSAVSDQGFRDAIGYAIDSQTIVDRVFNGHALPGQGLVSPTNVLNYGDLSSIARTFDPAEAATRLDAAGYKLGADGFRVDKEGKPISLKLILDGGSPESALAAQFVTEWLAGVGVTVTPVSLEIGAYYETLYKPDFDLALDSGAYDANQFILTQGTTNANGMFWDSPEYNALWDQYVATYEAAAKHDIASAMDRIFYEAAPGLVLAYQNQLAAYRTDKFTGWTDPASPDEFTLLSLSWPIPMFSRLAPVSAEASASPGVSASDSVTSSAPSASAGTGTDTGDTSGTPTTALVVVGGVIAAAIVILVITRRRRA